MAKRTWTLLDVEQDLFVDEIRITPDDVDGNATGYAVTKRTLRGGLRDGVDVIEVDNGTFRFVIIPTRGMGLWRAMMGELCLGWQSPTKGPVNPAFVPLCEPSGLGWLSGFDELLARCGLESNGPPVFDDDGKLVHPLHGRIANTPAHKVEVTIDGDSGEISVTGVVDESRLFFNKLRLTSTVTTKVDQPGLTINDDVTNISGESGELQLLYHVNFGKPFLGEGAKLVAPIAKAAPSDTIAADNVPEWDTYGPEAPGLGEACFFFDLAADANGRTGVLLHNAAADRGINIRFNKNQLPCFTQWKNRQAASDGYVTGLEPATNFPNPRAFEAEKGRVITMQPGESRSFEVALEALGSTEVVNEVKQDIAKLQEGTTPNILKQYDPDYSSG